MSVKKKISAILNEATWDLQGFWITHEGEVLNTDHSRDLHHSDIVLARYPELKYEVDPNDAYKSETLSELAFEKAYELGWIHVNKNGDRSLNLSLGEVKHTPKTIRAVAKYLRSLPEVPAYVLYVGKQYTDFDDPRAFITAVEMALK